jgi:hypothetical protein
MQPAALHLGAAEFTLKSNGGVAVSGPAATAATTVAIRARLSNQLVPEDQDPCKVGNGGAVTQVKYIQLTHGIESARFQPLTYEVKTWFQNVVLSNSTFQMQQLAPLRSGGCDAMVACAADPSSSAGRDCGGAVRVRMQLPHTLERARFQPLNLSSEKLVLSSLCSFKCNLYRYTAARAPSATPATAP